MIHDHDDRPTLPTVTDDGVYLFLAGLAIGSGLMLIGCGVAFWLFC